MSTSPVAPTHYHASPSNKTYWSEESFEEVLLGASNQEVLKWANDPNCIEMDLCVKEVSRRVKALADRRANLEHNPFDPRTEVSADARHIAHRIAMHLWIIFLLLPFICLVLYTLLHIR
jgi:hypothetical protein